MTSRTGFRPWLPALLLLWACLPPGDLFPQGAGRADAPASADDLYAPIARPDAAELEKKIRNGFSFISRKGKTEAADLLSMMDRHTIGLLESHGIMLKAPEDLPDWFETCGHTLGGKVPASEKAILCGLNLQTAMLDRHLRLSDAQTADLLRLERSRIRVRKNSERVFGDVRDNFVCAVLEGLKNIGKLLEAEGIRLDEKWEFPVHLKNFSQVENYLLKKIRLVDEKVMLLER